MYHFNSFFLDHTKIGKPRAHVATQLLMEMNPDVKGDYIEETCDQLLSNNPDFFCSFSVVIATGLTEKYTFIYSAAELSLIVSLYLQVITFSVISFVAKQCPPCSLCFLWFCCFYTPSSQ